ncbi:ABC transporter permease [Clostridium sardiniense]|uniref:ABC transporter permease n=1 Tax=Clostridium sardiniense TaxID=29369 RepID=A0ABS7KT22_CLOSR|nr:ABC transporter permease [Clostridium sardiniense]MBY0753961.1 ABC transporter permease [Clostridium sardiniense]MDQ0459523.1 oligopeptide transport system permease protein [Clostridium sardiniense]
MAEISRDKFKIVGIDKTKSESIVRPNLTYWQDAWRRLKRNKVALVSLIVLIVIVLMCVIQPLIAGENYAVQNMGEMNQGPSAKHFFGTDNLGRDLFDRLWIGGRVSLIIAFVGTLIECLVGIIYGGISGYFGGRVDNVMMRIVEILNSIPYLIIVILIAVRLGNGILPLLIALCITGWTGIARMVRGQVMQLKESEYVMAAKTLGASPLWIIFKHMIPNSLGIIIVYITFDIPSYIFAEAFLSFIGLGIQPPETSWGAMASAGQQVMLFYPSQLIFPSLAIAITMLAFNLLGDGLRDALDPKLRQ